jgi:hypothetical protein
MLREFQISLRRFLLSGVIATIVWAGCFEANPVAVGQEADPTQKAWIEKYETQANAPKPSEMLLNTDAEPELSEGFVAMFNGTDLSGWNSKGGTCTFEVRDGQIVGTCVPGSESTYLCTEKADYTDFVFTCDLKWEIDGNTGVQFRSNAKPSVKKTKKGKKAKADTNSNSEKADEPKTEEPKPETVFGPQVEMEGLGKADRHWSGGIYGQSCGGYFYPLWLKEHQAARAAEKTDDWNRVTISAKGNVVKTWLNGVPASHWVDDGTYAKGFFALQVHKGKAGTILFKNIRIKELNEQE